MARLTANFLGDIEQKAMFNLFYGKRVNKGTILIIGMIMIKVGGNIL